MRMSARIVSGGVLLAGVAFALVQLQRGPVSLTASKPPAPVVVDRGQRDAGYMQVLEWYLSMRAYPRDEVDWDGFQRAAIERDTLMHHPTTDAVVWRYVGPTDLGSSGGTYFGPSPISGRVSAIAFQPGNINQPKVYVGSPSGGLWRDGPPYNNWAPLGDDWPFLAVSSIAIHPTNPNVILAGTGDFHGGRPIGARGIRRSVDGGSTWTEISAPIVPGICVSGIVFDPDNPNIVLATTGRGGKPAGGRLTGNGRIYRSTDQGANWEAVGGTPAAIWSDVKVGALSNTTGTRLYYATALAPTGMVWRSADQGKTWEQLPIPLANQEYDCVEVATSPTEPGTVYLLGGIAPAGAGTVGVWRSKTGGKPADSWKPIAADVNEFPNHDTGTDYYNWSQMSYDVHLTCSTFRSGNADNDVLYAGLIDLVASVNANVADSTAVRWRSVGQTYSSNTPGLHNDQQSMAIRPSNPNQALVGCDGGIYILEFDPRTTTWKFLSFLNGRLGISEIYTAAWFGGDRNNPATATRILAGAQDNEHYRHTEGERKWPNAVQSGDGHGCEIIPVATGAVPNVVAAGMIQYASGYTNTNPAGVSFMTLQRTADAWANQADVSPFFNSGGATGDPANNEAAEFFPPIAINATADEIYTGSTFLYRRTANNAWVRTGLNGANTTPITALPITAIAVAPSRPATVYVGATNGTLFVSRNRGAGGSWTQIDAGRFGRPVTSIAVHPTNPNTVLVALGGNTGQPRRLWRCLDTSTAPFAWTSVSGTGRVQRLPDVQTNVVVFDPDAPSRIWYVGTDIGFFYTKDSGQTWRDGNTNLGLPKVGTQSIRVLGNGANASIYVATFGRGIWRVRYGDLP